MIFLDQDSFAEVLAMIAAAADADRIFFEGAKTRCGLARVQNFAPVPATARTNRWVSVATPLRRCNRFNATRSPVKVRARCRYTRRDLSWRDFFAVVQLDLRFHCGSRSLKTSTKRLDPGEDERRFGNHFATRTARGGNDSVRGDVAGSDILGQKGLQQIVSGGVES
jgi:hypothetical protein